MKVDLDARTLEAMRKLATLAYYTAEQNEWRDTVRTFLAQYDSARDVERDEALANMLRDAWLEAGRPRLLGDWRKLARAARAHIEAERAS